MPKNKKSKQHFLHKKSWKIPWRPQFGFFGTLVCEYGLGVFSKGTLEKRYI